VAARLVLIGGPTASGKSALALAIARATRGVVINADSMQVYRELPILTAQPSAAVRVEVPHRLYGVVPVAERCSVGAWLEKAQREIAAAAEAGWPAVVVGGTGLYLLALVDGLAPVPKISPETRSRAQARLECVGPDGLHAELLQRDPMMAARLRPTDRQRLVRAWEVLEGTGRSLAEWQHIEQTVDSRAAPRPLQLLMWPERPALYAACDSRFAAMVAAGAIDEAQAVADLALPDSLPAMKALGVRQLLAHLGGELTLAAAIASAQRATRNYAKRQLTWFRNRMAPATRIEPDEPDMRVSPGRLTDILSLISNAG